MAEVNGNFDFKKYDVGGNNATANDGKLTGQEAQNARADGWTIWDGFSEENETPENVNHQQNSNTAQGGSLRDKLGNIKLPEWAKDMISHRNSDNGAYLVRPEESQEEIFNRLALRHSEVDPSTIVKNMNDDDKKKIIDDMKRRFNSPQVNGKPIDDVIADLTGKNDDKLTAEQKEARAELNQKQSSIGMTYADAKAKVAEILQKYPNCYDEVEVPNEPKPDANGFIPLIYLEPIKTKVFNPDKLPEPARTEYKEAMASMAEIENNNSALAQKGGINKMPMSNPEINTIEQKLRTVDNRFGLDGLEIKDGKIITKEKEPTETQKSARAKLNEKVSSTGISYKDAKATIENITNQYKNNTDYQSEFEQEQSKEFAIYRLPVKAFDPYKLKGADREVYFKALSAIHEIETANYALLLQAGLEPTKNPQKPKSKYDLL